MWRPQPTSHRHPTLTQGRPARPGVAREGPQTTHCDRPPRLLVCRYAASNRVGPLDVEIQQSDGETRVSGLFYRLVLDQHATKAFERRLSESSGRFHAPGQSALYMSPTAEWARVALAPVIARDGLDRVVTTALVGSARILDLRDERQCAAVGVNRDDADAAWREPVGAGRPPPSWTLADKVRNEGFDGIIDPSKLLPGAWHLILFEWNIAGRPMVRPVA